MSSGVISSLKAAQELEEQGINIRVLYMHTIKPLDDEAVMKAAREIGIVVTVEDHNILGGLGSTVAKAVLKSGIPYKFKGPGIPVYLQLLANLKSFTLIMDMIPKV